MAWRLYHDLYGGSFRHNLDSADVRSVQEHIDYLNDFEFEDWKFYRMIEILDDNSNLILWRRTFYKLAD